MNIQHNKLQDEDSHPIGYIRSVSDLPSAETVDQGIAAFDPDTGKFYICDGQSWVPATGSMIIAKNGTPLQQSSILNFVGGEVRHDADTDATVITLQSVDKAQRRLDAVFTGEVPTTVQQLSGLVSGDRFRIEPELLVNRGWVKDVFGVTMDGQPLIAEENYIFYPEKQMFYFLCEHTGDAEITATAHGNQVMSVTLNIPVEDAVNVTTACDIDVIASVEIKQDDEGAVYQSVPFLHDNVRNYLFMPTSFTADSIDLLFAHESGQTTVKSLSFSGTNITLPGFFDTVNGVALHGIDIDPEDYTVADGKVTFAESVLLPSSLHITGLDADGNTLSHFVSGFTGTEYMLPTSTTGLLRVILYGIDESRPQYSPFAFYDDATKTVHIGDNYPADFGGTVSMRITGTTQAGHTAVMEIFSYVGNGVYLPREIDEVLSISIDDEYQTILFEPSAQRLLLSTTQSGVLAYSATVAHYTGLATGGETLEIVHEMPGLLATTAGTGEDYYTLLSTPDRVWTYYLYLYYGLDAVVITDEDSVCIYEDYAEDARNRIAPGFTAQSLLPLTPKLPLAPRWAQARRDDRAFLNTAFSIDTGFQFRAATFMRLDDALRAGDNTLSAGAMVTLSTDTATPVRGVAGVWVNGTPPVYYAGTIIPTMMVSTYKFWVCRVISPADNPTLTAGQEVLLCLQNTVYEDHAVALSVKAYGPDVSADIFLIEE